LWGCTSRSKYSTSRSTYRFAVSERNPYSSLTTSMSDDRGTERSSSSPETSFSRTQWARYSTFLSVAVFGAGLSVTVGPAGACVCDCSPRVSVPPSASATPRAFSMRVSFALARWSSGSVPSLRYCLMAFSSSFPRTPRVYPLQRGIYHTGTHAGLTQICHFSRGGRA